MLLLSLLAAHLAASQFPSATSPLLSPRRITGWRTKWSPGSVQLSANNRSKATAATFNFCATTTLLDAILEVTFPAGFDTAMANAAGLVAAVSGQTVQISGLTITAGVDTSVVVAGLGNPAVEGAYGPFALRTRSHSEGQQVDVNLHFATVYITKDAEAIGPLLVEVLGSSVVGRSGNSLSFKFKLGVSLWQFDTFVVEVDKEWTVAASAQCSVADYAGKTNNFNGTNPSNPHSLQCVIAPKSQAATANIVYIYGLAVDGIDVAVSPDSAYVDLRLAGVTTPEVAGNFYTWKISTVRFGTSTVLESTQQTLSLTVSPDRITQATWRPTWGLPASEVITGTVHYFDLSFTIVNKIPSGGSIEVVVSEVVNERDEMWGDYQCFVVTYIGRTAACSATAHSLVLTGLPVIKGGTTLSLRSLVKATTSAGVTAKVQSIKTFQSSVITNILIDTGADLAPFAVSAGTVASFAFTFHDSTPSVLAPTAVATAGGIALRGNEYRNAFQFGIFSTTWSGMASDSQFSIHCPFATELSDFSIGVPKNDWGFVAMTTSVSAVAVSSISRVAVSLPSAYFGATDTSPGLINFQGAICQSECQTSAYHLLVYQSSAGPSPISLPRVATNIATAYECRVSIQARNQPPARAAIRFQVLPQPWASDSYFRLACSSAVDGLPAVFSLLPQVVSVPLSGSKATYYIEFEFAGLTANFASGLTSLEFDSPRGESPIDFAVDYPIVTPTQFTAKHYYFNQRNFVAVAGLPISTNSAVEVLFPIGGFQFLSVQATARSYYLSPTDPRYKFTTHESSFPLLSLSASSKVSSFASDSVTPTASGSVGGELTGLRVNLAVATTPASYYLHFLLPTGVVWSAVRSITTLHAASSPPATYFSSPSARFKYAGMLIASSASLQSDQSSGTVLLQGFYTALGARSYAVSAVLGYSQLSSACLNYSPNIAFSTTTGAITSVTLSPNNVKTRGSDGVAVTITVDFVLQHGVPSGGSIALVLNSEWATTGCSSCAVTGLSASAICTIAATGATVTGFADFSSLKNVQVSIEVRGVLPPKGASSAAAFLSRLSTFTLYQSTNYEIDATAASSQLATISVSEDAKVGRTNWIQKRTYPSSAEATDVDLYLKFSLPYSVPKCGSLLVSSPLVFKLVGDLRNLCFLSPVKYRSCRMVGQNVEVVLAEDYPASTVLELYLDAAVDNPGGTQATSTGFGIIASWGGVVIDLDLPVQAAQNFTATPVAKGSITPSSSPGVTFSPTTASESATYSFIFTDSVRYSPGDQYWIVFPPQFDYFVGDAWKWFSTEANVYYLDCSCAAMGAVLCSVDHTVVVVSGGSAVAASTQIAIEVHGVVNPAFARTGAFQLYHTDLYGQPVSISQNFGTVTPTPLAGNLAVRSVTVSDKRLSRPADYTWRLVVTDTLTTDSQLRVLFPRQFDLERVDLKEKYECKVTYMDSNKSPSEWFTSSPCSTSGNWVSTSSPKSELSFKSPTALTFSVYSVGNPQWAQSRSPLTAYSDFDVVDGSLWPLHPLWVGKFDFFVYRAAALNLAYSSRTYQNVNAAHAGYAAGLRPLYVNMFDPQTRNNRIVVRAGTQTTDILISTPSPLSSKSITFTPASNPRTGAGDKMLFTSLADNWTLRQGETSIRFRVSAAIDLPKGLYMIDWTVDEAIETGLSDKQYDPPATTLVEVLPAVPRSQGVTITAAATVAIGGSTPPIRLSVASPPHDSFTVNISLSKQTVDISISPATVEFTPDSDRRYFQVQVAASYDITDGNSLTLLFTLTGADAAVYNILDSLKIGIYKASTQLPQGNVVGWHSTQPSKTAVSISPTSDQVGVIYYQLSAYGSPIIGFSALKASVTSQANNQASVNAVDTEQRANETWAEFQRRIYTSHLSSVSIGSIPMAATVSPDVYTFDWLFADTRYQLSGYLDNLLQSSATPPVHVESFRTAAADDPQPLAISFQGNVDRSYADNVKWQFANAIGVNPNRLVLTNYLTQSRRLQTPTVTSFSFTLLPVRGSSGPSPAIQATLSVSSLAQLSQSLQSTGIAASLLTVSSQPLPARTVPIWVVSPRIKEVSSGGIVMEMQSSAPGEVCCVAVASAIAAVPRPEQVLLGLDGSNVKALGDCAPANVTAVSTVAITGVETGGNYSVFCTAGDDYAVWPTLMSATGGAVEVTIGASAGGEEDSRGLRQQDPVVLLVLLCCLS